MKYRKKIHRTLFLSALLVLVTLSNTISQEVVNITEIPHSAVGHAIPEEIRKEGEIYYVPIFKAKNDIFEYLPEMEVDSFHTPISPDSGMPNGATMYATYTPNIGFTDHLLLNYMSLFDKLSFDEDRVSFSAGTPTFGFNDNIAFPYPVNLEELYNYDSRIGIYDIALDSFLYLKTFAEGRKFNLTSAIDGDFVYLNIPLTYSEDEDLIFMGDTLIYPENTHVSGCNYLSKINYITGEKEWTRHIGYGDVEKIVIDKDHRINIDIITGVAPMLDFEWIHDEAPTVYGQYDRLLYRMSADGAYLDDTHIHTIGSFAIYEVEINEDGSFQAFGGVSSPIHVYVEGDTLDFTDAYDLANNKAIVLVYDEDLNYQWGKKIASLGSAYNTAVHKNPNGDYILSVWIEGTQLFLDGVEYDGPPDPGLPEDHYQSILTRFDPDGILLGDPVFCTHRNRIHDVQALGEDHFLILFEKFGWLDLNFLGVQPTNGFQEYTYVVEYKGDIYNIMTAIDEFLEEERYLVWPNPVGRGGDVNINLPNHLKGKLLSLRLLGNNGKIINHKVVAPGSEAVVRLPLSIAPGTYYINISTSNYKTTLPIVVY